MLKRGYHGVYHQMSAKHLQRYVNEFAGRQNVRDMDTLTQMQTVVMGMVGRAADVPGLGGRIASEIAGVGAGPYSGGASTPRSEPAMFKPTPTLFGESRPHNRTLYYGDCLDWMSRWESQSVDLIYLEPPFNSNANYNVLYTDRGAGKAQYRAFEDTWHWDSAAETRLAVYEGAGARRGQNAILGLFKVLGPSGMLAYLTYMAERLEHCYRILKPTGSIYLHCDPTASHGLKLVMDTLFGADNFRNEIVWRRTGAHGRARRWGPIHDTILFYSASDQYTRNRVYQDYDPDYIETFYRFRDKHGRYRHVTLDGPGERTGSSGETWRGVNPGNVGRHWEVPPDRALPDWFSFPEGCSDMTCQERLDVLDEQGMIYWPKKGSKPQYKRYLVAGNPIQDIIYDIRPIGSSAKERLGYPTQKPIALLERIIEASSSPGDMVLDPFCGCGTAVDAANRLGRRWAGIDISSFAIDLIRKRRMSDLDIATKGIPYDLQSARMLARDNPFSFESWAIMRLPGFQPNQNQVGDGGIDGRATLATTPANHKSRLALAQAKGGKFNLSHLRDFIHVTDRDKAALGVYVTLDTVKTPAAKAEAAKARTVTVGAEQYPRCQLWPIADYFDDRKPHLPTMTDPYTGKPLVQEKLFA